MRELKIKNTRTSTEAVPISQVPEDEVRRILEATDYELAPCLEDGETLEGVREACRIDLVRRALGL